MAEFPSWLLAALFVLAGIAGLLLLVVVVLTPFAMQSIVRIRRFSEADIRGKSGATPKTTPQDYGLEAETVTIKGRESAELFGLWIPALTENAETVIVLHGMHLSHLPFLPIASGLHGRDFNVLMPDIRAHGRSGGGRMTFGELEADDIRRWLDWLGSHHGISSAALLGLSLGGIIGLRTAPSEQRISALVIQSPYTSLYDEVKYSAEQIMGPFAALCMPFFRMYVRAKIRVDMRTVDLLSAVKRIHQPVLFILGGRDKVVSPEMTRRVLQASTGEASLMEVPEAGHNNIHHVAGEEYYEAVATFVRKHHARAETNDGLNS